MVLVSVISILNDHIRGMEIFHGKHCLLCKLTRSSSKMNRPTLNIRFPTNHDLLRSGIPRKSKRALVVSSSSSPSSIVTFLKSIGFDVNRNNNELRDLYTDFAELFRNTTEHTIIWAILPSLDMFEKEFITSVIRTATNSTIVFVVDRESNNDNIASAIVVRADKLDGIGTSWTRHTWSLHETISFPIMADKKCSFIGFESC